MGCGVSSVPKVIIPDPEPGVEHKFLCKKQGLLASDHEVFKDFDEKQKWLFIDKKGSLFKDPQYVLENYVREKGEKQGQALCVAKVGDAKVKIYDITAHEDSDDSDGYSDSEDEGEKVDTKVTKMKWAQSLKVKFYSDRKLDNKIAEMKVKAKGKAKKTETTITETDPQGNKSTRTSVDISKKVKKLIYHFQFEPNVQNGQKFDIEIKGKLNGKESDLEWQCEMFRAETKGFWSPKAKITTNYSMPGLALLCGFLCTIELSPNDIAANVVVW